MKEIASVGIVLKRIVMELFAEYDACEFLYWHTDLRFYVLCNDVFWWGVADAEWIDTKEDVEMMRKCFEDSDENPTFLYCARKRGMRPQGAMYKYLIGEEKLFDACGPEREDHPLNTPKSIVA